MASLTAVAAEDIKPQAYFYLGKFQPFHNGHLNVLTQMVRQAEKDNARVFLFSTKTREPKKKHPIPPEKKEEMLQEMLNENFPEIEIEFKMVKDIIDATKELANQNITHAKIMAGDDRVQAYMKIGRKRYNGVYFTVSPIDRKKDNISGTGIRYKILRGENVDSDVNKVYKPETITELSDIIQAVAHQQDRHTRKASGSKTKKNGGGKRPKTHRRRRRRTPRRRRRTRRYNII